MNFNKTPAATIRLPFLQAIDFFNSRANIPTDTIDRIIDEENQFAFYVSGLTKAEFLDSVKNEVRKGLTEGATFADFAKGIEDIATKQGWSAHRQFLIWQTNLNQAYRQGAYDKLKSPAVWDETEGLQWIHGNSKVPRPHHLALNGRIFPKNTVVFGGQAYPPCGFGCRCRVYPVFRGESDLDKLEAVQGDSYSDKNGKKYRWDAVADPGFGYTPSSGNRQQSLDRIRERLPSDLAKQVP